jgi:hypothetical protein
MYPQGKKAYRVHMSPEAMNRERLLIEEVERELSEFVRMCRDPRNDCILMQQDAFAPAYGPSELLLLGKAIKYAGLMGKEVRIIPSLRQPS